MATTQDQIRTDITNQIVDALKNGGIPPWRRPWGMSPNSGMPTNAVSGRRYSGVNVLLLRMASMRHGFRSKHWGTFNQWTELGGKVMRRPENVPPGKWGTSIVFFKTITKTETDPFTGEETEETFPLLKNYSVFNIDQVHGEHLDHLRAKDDDSTKHEFTDFEPAEAAIKATNADIRFGGDHAFYCVNQDFVAIPNKQKFEKPKEFYATAFHELAHWSEKRCSWRGCYAEGELRAEMSSAFMLAELGVPQSDDLTNHQAYLANWLKALSNDSRFIFRAASAASKATDFVLSFSRQPEPELVPF